MAKSNELCRFSLKSDQCTLKENIDLMIYEKLCYIIKLKTIRLKKVPSVNVTFQSRIRHILPDIKTYSKLQHCSIRV